jgi:hypothetical protein
MIFDIAPTMLTGYYRIRDPAAFVQHGNPRAKDIVCSVICTRYIGLGSLGCVVCELMRRLGVFDFNG